MTGDAPAIRKIDAAIRSLPLLKAKESLVRVKAAALADMTPAVAPAALQPASAAAVENQLVEIRWRTSRLAMILDRGGATKRAREQLALLMPRLFEDTFVALANSPPLSFGGSFGSIDILWLRFKLPADLKRGDSSLSSDKLRVVARAAQAAIEAAPNGRQDTRPTNFHAHALARLVISYYEDLTGLDAGIWRTTDSLSGRNVYDRGPFYKFARSVFEALDTPVRGLPFLLRSELESARKEKVTGLLSG